MEPKKITLSGIGGASGLHQPTLVEVETHLGFRVSFCKLLDELCLVVKVQWLWSNGTRFTE